MKASYSILIFSIFISLGSFAQTDFYAWKVLWSQSGPAGVICQGPVSIDTLTGTAASLECYEQMDYYFLSDADWINGVWYGVNYETFGGQCSLMTIDPITGAETFVGLVPATLTGFTYDYSNSTAYGMDYGGTLYSIDLTSGAYLSLGSTGVSGVNALACSETGEMYCTTNGGDLYSINQVTLSSSLIGSTGVSFYGETGLTFDREANVLYGTFYNSSSSSDRGLYQINTTSGNAVLVHGFPDYRLAGLAIPFSSCTNTYGADIQVQCSSYTWIDGITYTSSNNTATYTLTNAAGCDSIVTLDLTINVTDTSATLGTDGVTITANTSNADDYQWIDCGNGNSIIPGETDQSFTAVANGDYAVIVTSGGCSDTSSCITINSVGIFTIQDDLTSINVYPNPTHGIIKLNGNIDQIESIEATNLIGEKIPLNSEVVDGEFFVQIGECPESVIILNIYSKTGAVTHKSIVLIK